jgi:hypothetical protein
MERSVKEYGETKKQHSIRKKLSCHKISAAHIKACSSMDASSFLT